MESKRLRTTALLNLGHRATVEMDEEFFNFRAKVSVLIILQWEQRNLLCPCCVLPYVRPSHGSAVTSVCFYHNIFLTSKSVLLWNHTYSFLLDTAACSGMQDTLRPSHTVYPPWPNGAQRAEKHQCESEFINDIKPSMMPQTKALPDCSSDVNPCV